MTSGVHWLEEYFGNMFDEYCTQEFKNDLCNQLKRGMKREPWRSPYDIAEHIARQHALHQSFG